MNEGCSGTAGNDLAQSSSREPEIPVRETEAQYIARMHRARQERDKTRGQKPVSQRIRDWLEARAFCGNPNCDCARDWGAPCEEYQPAEHPFFRCGDCGWAESEHEPKRREIIARYLKELDESRQS